jgi:cytoskeleton protein RodZ
LTLRQKIKTTPLDAGEGFKQIGLTLKSARRSQKLSVRDVSEKLRISVDYLTKLESGAFDELPAPAYVTGFLRSYGRCVGLAPDTLVTRYMTLAAGNDSKPNYQTPMNTRPPQRSAPAVASILVLCAGLAYGGWFSLKTDKLSVIDTAETVAKTAMRLPNQESISIDVVSPDLPATFDLAGNDLADNEEKAAATPTKETTVAPATLGLDTTKRQLAEKVLPELVSSETISADTSAFKLAGDELEKTQILTLPNSDTKNLRNSSIAIANLRDPAKEITIRAVAASWVEIVRDNGEEVMAKLMQAGDSYVVEGNTRLYLSTGNAGGLMVVIGADDPLSIGDIGEIVRDLPLVTDQLRKIL